MIQDSTQAAGARRGSSSQIHAMAGETDERDETFGAVIITCQTQKIINMKFLRGNLIGETGSGSVLVPSIWRKGGR